jgi:hypothetical protein
LVEHVVRTLRRRKSFCTSEAGRWGQHRRTHLMAVELEFPSISSPPCPRKMALAAAAASTGANGGSSIQRFLFPLSGRPLSSPAASRASCLAAAVARPAYGCCSLATAPPAASLRSKRSAAILVVIQSRERLGAFSSCPWVLLAVGSICTHQISLRMLLPAKKKNNICVKCLYFIARKT